MINPFKAIQQRLHLWEGCSVFFVEGPNPPLVVSINKYPQPSPDRIKVWPIKWESVYRGYRGRIFNKRNLKLLIGREWFFKNATPKEIHQFLLLQFDSKV